MHRLGLLGQVMNWIVVVVKANQEFAAEQKLRTAFGEDACQVYCPCLVEAKPIRNRKSNKIVRTRKPMYPGYLFLGLQEVSLWPRLLGIDVVSGVLLVDRSPCVIGDSVIDQIRAIESDDLDTDVFEIGTKVPMTIGDVPVNGIYVGQGFVEISAFGRVVRVNIPKVALYEIKRNFM